MKWTGYVARMGESSGFYRILVGKPLPPGENPIAVNKYYYYKIITTEIMKSTWFYWPLHAEPVVSTDLLKRCSIV